jgi:hypothetical protein
MNTVFAAAIALFIQGQLSSGPSQAEIEAMKKLDFLVGKWEGEGWMTPGPGAKEVYKGSETVQKKLQGKAVLIEGKFTDSAGKVVHETLAVVTFDEKEKKYRFRTYLFNRPEGEYELHLANNGFWWEVASPNGPTVRFDMVVTAEGAWRETGTVNIPGRDPMQILEMVLKKK